MATVEAVCAGKAGQSHGERAGGGVYRYSWISYALLTVCPYLRQGINNVLFHEDGRATLVTLFHRLGYE